MKRIKSIDLANVVGGQLAPLALRQGQATVNYNNCLGTATNKSNAATAAAGSAVQAGSLSPAQGIAQGVDANRTLRSDVAACNAQFPIPRE
ncbi:MAG TPA: hypothetical protein VGL61_27090 [Kofleriaceae bacterium]|jgi:hypothetical protein